MEARLSEIFFFSKNQECEFLYEESKSNKKKNSGGWEGVRVWLG